MGAPLPVARRHPCFNRGVSSPDLVDAGRAQLRAVLGVLLVLIAAPFVAEAVRGDFSRLGSGAVTLALTVGLFWNLWRGARWARSIAVGLAMVGGLLLTVLGMLLSAGNAVGFLVLIVGLGFIACGLAIVSSAAIDAYLREARK